MREVKLLSTAREFYERLGFQQKPDHYMHKKLASDARSIIATLAGHEMVH